jgi:hypothetical protein
MQPFLKLFNKCLLILLPSVGECVIIFYVTVIVKNGNYGKKWKAETFLANQLACLMSAESNCRNLFIEENNGRPKYTK